MGFGTLEPDTRPTIADLNRNIIERSMQSGVTVLEQPDDGDLTVVCEFLHNPSALLAGEGVVLEVDPASGKIGSCVVLDYAQGLFARRPILAQHLRNYRDATSAEDQQDHGLRLFHGLLAVADAELAAEVRAAYRLAADLQMVTEQSTASAALGLLQLSGRAMSAAQRRLRSMLNSAVAAGADTLDAGVAAVRRCLYAAALPPAGLAPALMGAASTTGELPAPSTGHSPAPGTPRITISWLSEDDGHVTLYASISLHWGDPRIDPVLPVVVTLLYDAEPPADLPWEPWALQGLWSGEFRPGEGSTDLELLKASSPLSGEQLQQATRWAASVRVDVYQVEPGPPGALHGT